MSRMLPLIMRRPTLCSSTSTPLVMRAMSFSRSLLISSMLIEANTTRIWPMMISEASCCTSSSERPSRRVAAFCMTSGSVDTPMVNEAGASMRMFWLESAPFSSMSMLMGVRSR